MEKSRRAAADIFMEQQAQQIEEESATDDFGGDEAQKESLNAPGEINASIAGYGAAPAVSQAQKKQAKKSRSPVQFTLKSSEELQLEKEPINVRVTGRLFWKRVIVPPNAYVVHTRIGRRDPVTMGLGKSFAYKPNKDAYLVIPAAMQTIGVVANCISSEKQGINVLAYVQWQINDFSVAYKKLDLSDPRDPLGITNAQLREQAEAAIKDKIATMSVEEVLTDKAPVIEELTNRLKAVTEGRLLPGSQDDSRSDDASRTEGLGIKIVTVQIREALVSSTTLWENLQSPFRHEQSKKERISYLDMVNEISNKEMETKRLAETRETETLVEIERIKQKKQTESLLLKLTEEAARYEREQESVRKRLALEEETVKAQKESEERKRIHENELRIKSEIEILKQEDERVSEEALLALEGEKRAATIETERAIHELAETLKAEAARIETEEKKIGRITGLKGIEAEFNLSVQAQVDRLAEATLAARIERDKQEQKAALEIERERGAALIERMKSEAEVEEARQRVRNILSDNILFANLIEKLPEIASKMPEIKELKVISTGSDAAFEGLVSFVARMLAVAENLGIAIPAKREKKNGSDSQAKG